MLPLSGALVLASAIVVSGSDTLIKEYVIGDRALPLDNRYVNPSRKGDRLTPRLLKQTYGYRANEAALLWHDICSQREIEILELVRTPWTLD